MITNGKWFEERLRKDLGVCKVVFDDSRNITTTIIVYYSYITPFSSIFILLWPHYCRSITDFL